ncbi:PAS domain-containing protein [Oligoflexus tunisiensis]|uniref:PAS domain-containing protein n=1 Tax=Oligoflexus tunisiensis TaxID=708132 RepID=UPI00114CA6BE|nr:PAS domain S-box protein [Oligoflexus tunisiensis]
MAESMESGLYQAADSLSILESVIESIADAILIIDNDGHILAFNRKFLQIWDLPYDLEGLSHTRVWLKSVLRLLDQPKVFVRRLQEIEAQPDREWFDLVKLKNGRVFERYVIPRILHGERVGRVMTWRDSTTCYRAMETLRESESRFRRLADSNLIGMAFTDIYGTVHDANRYVLDLIGYSKAELLAGKIRWTDLTAPEYSTAQAKALLEIRDKGSCTPYEKEYRRKDGSRVHALVGAALIEGSREDMVTFILDITDQKKAERELKLSEERFRTVFELAPVGITVLDTEGNFVQVNSAFCRMLGYSEDEIKKLGIQGISHPGEYERQLSLLSQLNQGQLDRFEMEKRYIPKDGVPLWVHLCVSLGRDPEGQPTFGIGVILDINEDHGAKEALKFSEARFRAVFEYAEVGIGLIDRTGFIFKVNPALTQMLGYSEEEFQKLGIKGISHPDDFEACWIQLTDLAAGKIDRYEAEKRYISRSGEVVWCHLICSLARGLQNEPLFCVGMVTNVTERIRHQEERDRLLSQESKAHQDAMDAIKLRDDFITLASHELRTPLTPLKFQVQYLRRSILSGMIESPAHRQDLLRMLEISDDQLNRAKRLVEDMLDASLIQAGHLVLAFTNLDLSELVKKVATQLTREFEKAGCVLELDLAPQVRGRWDRMRIERIIHTLLLNAIKFGPGKLVRVTTSADGEFARLRVRDHGIGISKENQTRIFQRFERIAPVETYGGFGLGLFIANQVALAHRGKICVESEVNEGSTFTVVLPHALG